jgi:hypothetical protein
MGYQYFLTNVYTISFFFTSVVSDCFKRQGGSECRLFLCARVSALY